MTHRIASVVRSGSGRKRPKPITERTNKTIRTMLATSRGRRTKKYPQKRHRIRMADGNRNEDDNLNDCDVARQPPSGPTSLGCFFDHNTRVELRGLRGTATARSASWESGRERLRPGMPRYRKRLFPAANPAFSSFFPACQEPMSLGRLRQNSDAAN
jgi:hypothetical protein